MQRPKEEEYAKLSFFDRMYEGMKHRCGHEGLVNGFTFGGVISLAHFAYKGTPYISSIVFLGVFGVVSSVSIKSCILNEQKNKVIAYQLQKAAEYHAIYEGTDDAF